MSNNDCLIRFEWSDFLVSFLYSTWSSTNTIFECISPLSFTFLFPFFPIFLCYTKIRENKFSHKFHISVAPTDNCHKPTDNHHTTCHCRFLLPLTSLLLLIPFADVALSAAPNNLSAAATAVLAQWRHCRTLAYLLSAANFAVATLPPPLTSLPPPTSNIAAAVYADAVSTAANKN